MSFGKGGGGTVCVAKAARKGLRFNQICLIYNQSWRFISIKYV